MKSFEIKNRDYWEERQVKMNYKLEKFWNYEDVEILSALVKWTINLKSFEINIVQVKLLQMLMNYKLEKFWNSAGLVKFKVKSLWTINLKSFEIV